MIIEKYYSKNKKKRNFNVDKHYNLEKPILRHIQDYILVKERNATCQEPSRKIRFPERETLKWIRLYVSQKAFHYHFSNKIERITNNRMLRPLAMESGEFVAADYEGSVREPVANAFEGDEPPCPGEVSDWVLSQIQEVSQLLGVSFERHKDEAIKLFSAIKASWRGNVPSGRRVKV